MVGLTIWLCPAAAGMCGFMARRGAAEWGYSLWELEVYGQSMATYLPLVLHGFPSPAVTPTPTPAPIGAPRPVSILVDDFSPQPYQGESEYRFNRLNGDRGALNNSVMTWGRGQVTTTIAAGNTWGGGWLSLNHPLREGLPINFAAILPEQILPPYQSRITGITARVAAGTPGRTFRLELKDHGALRWTDEVVLTGGAQVVSIDLPALGEINELVWVLDRAAPGDYRGPRQHRVHRHHPDRRHSHGCLRLELRPAAEQLEPGDGAGARQGEGRQRGIRRGASHRQPGCGDRPGCPARHLSRADALQIVNTISETLLLDLPALGTACGPTGPRTSTGRHARNRLGHRVVFHRHGDRGRSGC